MAREMCHEMGWDPDASVFVGQPMHGPIRGTFLVPSEDRLVPAWIAMGNLASAAYRALERYQSPDHSVADVESVHIRSPSEQQD
jgi:hypothetical protein